MNETITIATEEKKALLAFSSTSVLAPKYISRFLPHRTIWFKKWDYNYCYWTEQNWPIFFFQPSESDRSWLQTHEEMFSLLCLLHLPGFKSLQYHHVESLNFDIVKVWKFETFPVPFSGHLCIVMWKCESVVLLKNLAVLSALPVRSSESVKVWNHVSVKLATLCST